MSRLRNKLFSALESFRVPSEEQAEKKALEELENFYNSQHFQSSIPNIKVQKVSDSDHIDARYEDGSIEISYMDINDENIMVSVIHEATHHEFAYHHPRLSKVEARLDENKKFQEAHDSAYNQTIDKAGLSFGRNYSLKDLKRISDAYFIKMLSLMDSEELKESAIFRVGMSAINEHTARISEYVYRGVDPSRVSFQEAYEADFEVPAYAAKRTHLLGASFNDLAQFVSNNSLEALISMDERSLMEKFYSLPER